MQSFTPKSSLTFPTIQQNGTAGTFIAANNLVATAIRLITGSMDFGSSSVTVDSLTASGGGISSNGTTHILTGNLTLGSIPSLSGNGIYSFEAATGTQTFTPMSGGTYYSIVHSGAGTLKLAFHPLSCYFFNQSGGTLDFNGQDLTIANTSGSNLTVTNGTPTSFTGLGGRTLTVNGFASLSGASAANKINLDPGSAWNLNVTGALTGSFATLANSNATGSASAGDCVNCTNSGTNTNWNYSMSWNGAAGDGKWTTAGNWESNSVPTTSDNVSFNATSANATLDAAASIKSLVFTSGYAGAFNFSSNTLTINSGNADFRTGGTIVASAGTLAFTGTSSQTFIPKTGAVFPDIIQNGIGITTVSTNSLSAGNLTVSAGTFHLGASLNHVVKAISGSGTLNFGSSQLGANGNVDLSSLTVSLGASSTLSFGSSTSQTFTPNASVTALKLSFIGTGTATVLSSGFTTPVLLLNGGSTGILNLGAGLTHTVTTTLTVSSGGLDFGSSTLKVAAAAVDMSALVNLTPGTGTLEFSGSSAQTFTPKSGGTYPNITQTGNGGTTITTNNLAMGSLSIPNGTFTLGSGLTHTAFDVTSVGGTGGLDFGSSTLKAGGTVVNLSGLGTLTPGTGTLEFTGSSATSFTPKSGALHPNIKMSGAGTAALATNDLSAGNVDVTAGSLDITTKTLTVGGDLTIAGGTLTANVGNLHVTGNVSATSGTLACPASGNAFTVSGNFTAAPAVTWTPFVVVCVTAAEQP